MKTYKVNSCSFFPIYFTEFKRNNADGCVILRADALIELSDEEALEIRHKLGLDALSEAASDAVAKGDKSKSKKADDAA